MIMGYSTKAKQRAYNAAWYLRNRERVLAAQRGYQLKSRYGITSVGWDQLFHQQGKRCGACGTDTPGNRKVWHLDHCHKTKKVRGILCGPCNLALGMLCDDPRRLRALAAYVEERV